MTTEQVTRRVYSAEQLHRLRVSCSQPKLSEAIEEHDSDDAELIKGIMQDEYSPSFQHHLGWINQVITTPSSPNPSNAKADAHRSPTEHVLRGTKSFTARSFRSRTSGNSLRVPSNKENRSTADAENSSSSSANDVPLNGPVLGEISANGQVLRPTGIWKVRPSPTPSLKKKKAEAIVKAHGSPQHVRVTAGGRIVPSEQSPLCHPRYGYSAIKTNGGLIKFAPNHPIGKTQWTQATQNGFVAQDVNGRLCQIVNGTILPLNEVDGALRLYMHAPNLNITSRGSSFGPNGRSRLGDYETQQRTSSLSKPNHPPDPSLPTQTHALELEYSKLEHELKELDKTEVLHGRTMGKAAKEALVAKRRELVIRLDGIRKAIKSIKAMPAPEDAPPSPRPVSNDRPASPTRPGMPHFMSQNMRQDHDHILPPVGPSQVTLFGFAGPQQYGGDFGFQPGQVPEVPYGHPSLAATQPPLFVPPPSFDGSIAPAFGPFPDPSTVAVSNSRQAIAHVGGPLETSGKAGRLPQTDGAGSIKDGQKAKSPARSHAVDIKAPEPKQATALKSNLNPMSPAYKPSGGVLQNASNVVNKLAKSESHTSLSPVHQLKPLQLGAKAAKASDETISPTKKSPHLHSSSVSSFETADFFPRNTREYSTRKYAYPDPGSSEDKENVGPNHSASASDHAASAPTHTAGKQYTAPAQPLSTPAGRGYADKDHGSANAEKGSAASQRQGCASDLIPIPDRHAHNVSPKNRRSDHVFIYEDPSELPSLPLSSPQKYQSSVEVQSRATSRPVDKIDYSEASVDWIEGYRAGLARRPIEADRVGDFLDGYCAGLLKSKPTKSAPSSGSPIKAASSRRPSPAIIQSRSAAHEPVDDASPFENKLHSMDTLKEAIFAPTNEDAILSPAVDGPHINEAPLNLGAWAKNHDVVAMAEASVHNSGDGLAGFPFPHRTASTVKRQDLMSDKEEVVMLSRMGFGSEGLSTSQDVSISELPTQNTPEDSGPSTKRIVSLTGLDSDLYRQWPGARVFSNQLEWKSASSVAQAAGLASGCFAHAASDRGLPLQRAGSDEAAVASQRPMSILSDATMHTHSRFQEGSLDGITNPPNSPQPRSPPMSPSLSGIKHGKKCSCSSSPVKGVSPTKIKFETMAEKVGIKVSSGGKKDKISGSSPTGGASKRGWRDVWRGSRKDVSKDDGHDVATL